MTTADPITTSSTVLRQLAPTIADRLAAAEQKLLDLEAQLGDTRLDTELGKPGAGNNLAALTKQITVARDDVAGLREAHQRAVERDKAAAAEARRKMQTTQLAAMQQHARARHEAFVAFSAGIEAAAKAYGKFVDATTKMAAAVPIGCEPPPGAFAPFGECWPPLLASAEMYRASAGLPACLPGAKPPTEQVRNRPETIELGADVVKRNNEYVLATIKPQIDGVV